MKIAYIVLKGMPLGGGIEKYTEEIGPRLVAMGHEVVVYTMRHYGARDGEFKGMRIRTVPTLPTRAGEKLVASFIATLKQILEPDVDVVHYHAFIGLFAPIPRAQGRKTVTQGHGLEWKRTRWSPFGRRFLRTIESPSVRWADALTVVSKVQQEYLRTTYGRESTFIPTGVNPPTVRPVNVIREQYGLEGRDYILFASRLVREKCAHHLIEAYRKLDLPVKLVIAGDAQHEEAYKAELRALAGDDPRILFPGFVTGEPLEELMSNCSCFVLPSEIEGLPTVLLEAMSYGNACLSSDIPENQEAMGGFGHTFRFGDTDDLAAKLHWILEHPGEAAELGARGRDHVLANYSWDDIAKAFEALYQRTLAK